jgi:hypothetical protein
VKATKGKRTISCHNEAESNSISPPAFSHFRIFLFPPSSALHPDRRTKHSNDDHRGRGWEESYAAVSRRQRTLAHRYAHVEDADIDGGEIHKRLADGAEPASKLRVRVVRLDTQLTVLSSSLSFQANLLADNYSLYFNKTQSSDTAEYSCIINDRHSPESIIDLLIHGE